MDNQTVKTELDKTGVTLRLYSIQNIAYLAACCPENKADACLLQSAASSVVGMIQDLIDDIGA